MNQADLLTRIAATMRADVGPAVDDEYAKTQAFMAAVVLQKVARELVTADARYCLPIPERYSDAAAAPLLCAGLIGYRAYRAAGADAQRLGLYGFGPAAHLLAQVARAEQRDVYAFTRPGDRSGQAFARRLGAVWAGGSDELPGEPLDAAIIFAPVGSLVPAALAANGTEIDIIVRDQPKKAVVVKRPFYKPRYK